MRDVDARSPEAQRKLDRPLSAERARQSPSAVFGRGNVLRVLDREGSWEQRGGTVEEAPRTLPAVPGWFQNLLRGRPGDHRFPLQ